MEQELEKVRTEFDKYKVRAQSVLKQAKEKVENEDGRRNQDEINTIEKINCALEERMRNLMMELKTVQMEKQGLQEEHERLMERQSVLLQVFKPSIHVLFWVILLHAHPWDAFA